MAHFAELDDNDVVTRVLVVANAELNDNGVESEAKGIAFLASLYGHDRWRQTSYSGSMRKCFAGIGYRYDASRDAFLPPQPYSSWSFDDAAWHWVPPSPYPMDGRPYHWDNASMSWVSED